MTITKYILLLINNVEMNLTLTFRASSCSGGINKNATLIDGHTLLPTQDWFIIHVIHTQFFDFIPM